jgi:hypothetical protein
LPRQRGCPGKSAVAARSTRGHGGSVEQGASVAPPEARSASGRARRSQREQMSPRLRS